MTNEIIEDITKIVSELKEISFSSDIFYNYSKISHIRAKIAILNDLVRKVNEELA